MMHFRNEQQGNLLPIIGDLELWDMNLNAIVDIRYFNMLLVIAYVFYNSLELNRTVLTYKS